MKTALTKSEIIKLSLSETREKRKLQDCKVFKIKLSSNKLNLYQRDYLKRIFLEAKWFYNHILSQDNIFNVDTKIDQVTILNKDKEKETRQLTFLSSQMKQSIIDRLHSSVKGLSTKKKRGRSSEVGQIKFKSVVNSIPLKQYQNTYKIADKKLKIQRCKKHFYINGLNQIPKEAEFANAVLIRKPSGFYIHITCFIDKIDTIQSKEAVGIDFGIKTSLTLSNGIKIDAKFPVDKRIKREQRRLSKKKKGSNNWWKQKHKLNIVHEKYTNKKADAKNKIVSYLKNNYNHIGIQDENIKGWHSGWFGKQVTQSILGGIISELKNNSHTSMVDRFFPSTKLCPKCGTLNDIKLGQRTYICECGYEKDRDIHSALNILKQSVPTERRDFKPVEFNTDALDSLIENSTVSIDYEVGRYNSLELC